MTLIKICGITNLADALMSVRAGADMLGFNFYRASPRYIAPNEARRIIQELSDEAMAVGLFVNEESPERVMELADAAGVRAVQLHGDEPPEYCCALEGRFVIKALRVREDFKPESAGHYATEAILLDGFSREAYGGTGKTFDWTAAQRASGFVQKLFLAGGLSAANVAEAVRLVRPYAVDACSSVERAPGIKDEERLRSFVAAVRSAV
ncbi:MAG TPA: phosphoribosylanthranilate isomerase [Pyrinomonadaceae bacterium]